MYSIILNAYIFSDNCYHSNDTFSVYFSKSKKVNTCGEDNKNMANMHNNNITDDQQDR